MFFWTEIRVWAHTISKQSFEQSILASLLHGIYIDEEKERKFKVLAFETDRISAPCTHAVFCVTIYAKKYKS